MGTDKIACSPIKIVLFCVYLLDYGSPAAPLFLTTCRYASFRLSELSICSIRLLVSIALFPFRPVGFDHLYPDFHGRCRHCSTVGTLLHLINCSALRSFLLSQAIFTTMASADFSQFVVTRLLPL